MIRAKKVLLRLCLGTVLTVNLVLKVLAGANGLIPGLNTAASYLVYYGNWDSAKVDYARTNYHLVILHPMSNITAAQIAAIKRGRDNVAGTADDVIVLGYLSIGEDDRAGAPVTGDGLGPRIDPRASDNDPLSNITNVLGAASSGGSGFASYYLNPKSNQNGIPTQDPNFPGSYYVNAGAPSWWTVLKTMTKASGGQSGLDEILTTNAGQSYNCDGVFLDTLDTAAPNSFGFTTYEWTAPGIQALIQRIHTNYSGKLLIGNRGLFFYNPNLKTYLYNPRAYLDGVMFESYFSDASTNPISLSFPDNKYDYAPKLNAEAGRPDGFTVIALDYDQTPQPPQSFINQDYFECINTQGWPFYRTSVSLDASFNSNAAGWVHTNADTQPPVWDSTAANSPTPAAPRVGIQRVTVGNQSVTVYWDVARDQTRPVHYNIYYSTSGVAINFATATKLAHVAPALPANYNYPGGTSPGIYPYCYTITGLSNGITYFFAVRAEDSATPAHEDTNTVTIAATLGGLGAVSTYRTIAIDGSFADWTDVPWAWQGAPDTNVVNFLAVQFAHDTNYLYGHVKLGTPYFIFSDYYTHLFFDTDNQSAAGYPVNGASFGSEMMIESGYGYDQRNGSFNTGGITGLGWTIASIPQNNEFEFRVSLSALYLDSFKVFGTNTFKLLLQDNRGPELALETGIPYLLTPPQIGPLHITNIGGKAVLTWNTVGSLQTSPSLSPPSWADILGANSPYTNPVTSSARFYRLAW